MPAQSTAILDPRDAGDAPLPRHVEAPLGYVSRGAGKPAIDMSHAGARVERDFTVVTRSVRIANGRRAPAASLDREGFALTRHATAVRDFGDPAEVETVYYPETASLLRRETGASSVVVFDHNLRLDGGGTGGGTGGAIGGDRQPPVRQVHNDYTEASAARRAADLIGAEALAQARRFAIVNVWRPIRGPVLTAPLALADARSVAPEDLVAVDLVYPDRTGEIYHAAWSPHHRWVHYPRMARDEALLIKGHDSLAHASLGVSRVPFALHSAFDDPTTPPGAAPRESIEVRALVLFD